MRVSAINGKFTAKHVYQSRGIKIHEKYIMQEYQKLF